MLPTVLMQDTGEQMKYTLRRTSKVAKESNPAKAAES